MMIWDFSLRMNGIDELTFLYNLK